MTHFFASPHEAVIEMNERADEILPNLGEERKQGDDEGPSVDFFTPVRPLQKLSDGFVRLLNEEEYFPSSGNHRRDRPGPLLDRWLSSRCLAGCRGADSAATGCGLEAPLEEDDGCWLEEPGAFGPSEG